MNFTLNQHQQSVGEFKFSANSVAKNGEQTKQAKADAVVARNENSLADGVKPTPSHTHGQEMGPGVQAWSIEQAAKDAQAEWAPTGLRSSPTAEYL